MVSVQDVLEKLPEKVKDVVRLESVFGSHSSSSSSVIFGENSLVVIPCLCIYFMTNEIPQAQARDNSLFGWRS